MKHRLIRNVRASRFFDIFLTSGVTSILLLRFYLHLTGYPTIGGTKYHIAHMLWGGLLLVIACTISLGFLGERRKPLVAILGGTGFGVFIDEVGKFITRDNDYFFRPSIGIIYASFVGLYLLFSFLSRRQRLTSEEYQMNAITQLQEAIHHDLDPAEKAAVHRLLDQADQSSVVTRKLQSLLRAVDTVQPPAPSVLRLYLGRVDTLYRRLWRLRRSNQLVQIFFIVETIGFVVFVGLALQNNFSNIQAFLAGGRDYGHGLVIGQFVCTSVAAVLAVIGVVRLPASRVVAFEWFRRAVLVNLLLTEFFIFSRIQFGALPSFLFNLALLWLITFAQTEERRVGR